MNKLYCPHCFKASIYESAAPSLCGFCGKSYVEAAKSIPQQSPPATKPPLPRQQKPVYTEDDDQYDEIDNIKPATVDKLEVEPIGDMRGNREDIARIVGRGESGARRDIKRTKTKGLSEKQASQLLKDIFPNNSRESINI